MTLDELAAQVAEHAETMARLEDILQAQGDLGLRLEMMIAVLREQKPPSVNFNAPAAIPAPINFTPPAQAAGSFEITHHWEGNRITRSSVTRKG